MGSILLIGAGSSSSDSSGLASSPPTITSSATFSINENTTAVGTVTATGGQTPYTFSISGGADSALFTINSLTGVLAFLVAPNYEAPGDAGTNNVYNVTVRVTPDSGGYAEQAVAVTVLDVFDTPLIQWPLAGIDTTQTGTASGLTLTNNNTVQSGDGDGVHAPAGIGGSCSKFVSANSESYSVADAADLTIGTGAMTRYGWVRVASLPGYSYIFGKDDAVSNREEGLYYDTGSSQWAYYIFRAADSVFIEIKASTFGTVPTGTWMFVQTQVNPTTGLVRIRVNKGAWNSVSYGTGQAVKDTTQALYLGAVSFGGNLNGYMAKWRCDKSIVSDANLDAIYDAEVTFDPIALFNVAYLVADPNYCFTNAAGTTPAGEGDPILCWTATNGKKFTKASASGFTLQKANGLWVVRADGSGYLRATTGGLLMGSGFTMTTIYRSTTLGGYYAPVGFGDTTGTGERRIILIYNDNHIAFNGDSADFGSGTAVDDTWTAFLVGIDGSNNGNCYQDGASAGSGTPSLNSYTNDEITIGGTNASGDLFIGEYSRIGLRSSKVDSEQRTAWDTYAAGIVSALSAIFMLSSPIMTGAISASSIMG